MAIPSNFPLQDMLQETNDSKYALINAGYGQTEGGLWIPKKVTDEGYTKVSQNGSKTKILKEYLNTNDLLTETYFRYGENSDVDASTPLDVSIYRKKSIYIENNYDVAVNVDLRFKDLSIGALPFFGKAFNEELAAGASKFYSSVDYPLLEETLIGILITLTATSGNPTSGSLDIKFFGGA